MPKNRDPGPREKVDFMKSVRENWSPPEGDSDDAGDIDTIAFDLWEERKRQRIHHWACFGAPIGTAVRGEPIDPEERQIAFHKAAIPPGNVASQSYDQQGPSSQDGDGAQQVAFPTLSLRYGTASTPRTGYPSEPSKTNKTGSDAAVEP